MRHSLISTCRYSFANEYYRSALPSSLTFPASPFTSMFISILSYLALTNNHRSGYLPLILYLGTKKLDQRYDLDDNTDYISQATPAATPDLPSSGMSQSLQIMYNSVMLIYLVKPSLSPLLSEEQFHNETKPKKQCTISCKDALRRGEERKRLPPAFMALGYDNARQPEQCQEERLG